MRWLVELEQNGCRTRTDAAEVKRKVNSLYPISTLLLEEREAFRLLILVQNNMALPVSRRAKWLIELAITSPLHLVKVSCKEVEWEAKECLQLHILVPLVLVTLLLSLLYLISVRTRPTQWWDPVPARDAQVSRGSTQLDLLQVMILRRVQLHKHRKVLMVLIAHLYTFLVIVMEQWEALVAQASILFRAPSPRSKWSLSWAGIQSLLLPSLHNITRPFLARRDQALSMERKNAQGSVATRETSPSRAALLTVVSECNRNLWRNLLWNRLSLALWTQNHPCRVAWRRHQLLQ